MSTVEERRIRNQNIVRLAASGVTVKALADTYSLTKTTISNILRKHKADIEKKIKQDSSIIESRAKELVDQAAFHLYKSAKTAAETVVNIMQDEPDSRIRLTAAFGVLDRVGISPRKPEGEQVSNPDFVSPDLAQKLVEALKASSNRPVMQFGENSRVLINGAPVVLEKDTPFEEKLVIPEGKVKDVQGVEIKGDNEDNEDDAKFIPSFGLKVRQSE